MTSHSSIYTIQAKFHFYNDEVSLKKEWKEAAKENIKQTTFLEGILLKSLDKESPFLYVDFAVFYGGLQINSQPNSPKAARTHSLARRIGTPRIGPTRKSKINQKVRFSISSPNMIGLGCYDELECIVRDGVKQLPRTPVSKDSVYFCSFFQTDGHVQNLEQIWKTWSGADFTLWKCPHALNLRRVTLFKATTDKDDNTFIVLSECEEGTDHAMAAGDFLERLRERRCGQVGLYKIERYYIPPRERS